LNFRIGSDLQQSLREVAEKANLPLSAIIKHCIAVELPNLKKKYGA